MTKQLPADIDSFRYKHNACPESYTWTLQNCTSMQDVWDKAPPEWLVWVATRPGVLDEQALRKFACWCARQVWHLLEDERSKNAVEIAERFVNGEATAGELAAANAAAWAASRGTRDASWRESSSARAAAYSADDNTRTAWLAASAASSAGVAMTAQAQWLRENATPNFT